MTKAEEKAKAHAASMNSERQSADTGGSGMTSNEIKALRNIACVVIEAVKESGPLGAPGGHIYAALMTAGCTLHQYEQIMSGLVRAGYLRKDGECYHATEKSL